MAGALHVCGSLLQPNKSALYWVLGQSHTSYYVLQPSESAHRMNVGAMRLTTAHGSIAALPLYVTSRSTWSLPETTQVPARVVGMPCMVRERRSAEGEEVALEHAQAHVQGNTDACTALLAGS